MTQEQTEQAPAGSLPTEEAEAGSESAAPAAPNLLAALDLGSNSFHMVVARYEQGEVRTVDKLGEKIQLASGLDERNRLSEEAQLRGLDCLARFAQRLVGVPREATRVVATNTLRAARNRQEFIYRARQILGLPIEVISGREEARLIYHGVVHSLPGFDGRRLVIDIGGGSTEFIIGEWFDPQVLESLHMGCVSYTQRFFPEGEITEKGFRSAVEAARLELINIEQRYRRHGWDQCIGSSGTIKSVSQTLVAAGWSAEGVTRDGLAKLQEAVLKAKHVDGLQFEGLSPERRPIFPAGLSILVAAFEALRIESLQLSDGALREGVLYDLVGRFHHEDVRERTISAIQERYHVDADHAALVEHTALVILSQVEDTWSLTDPKFRDWLRWAVRLHEIGLAISHSGFHKHGAYLAANSDLTGFSCIDQQAVALLVRGHRRKFPQVEFEEFQEQERDQLRLLCIVLRLAVLIHHSRVEETLPVFSISVTKKKINLQFPENWLAEHPLTVADLAQETRYLKKVGFNLQAV